MASHLSTNGRVWRDPVRKPGGGQRLRLWASTAELAALTAYAAAHGLTVQQAAKQALATWTASQEAG